jgi:colanic acid/amylovoran biosynthesis glycosyltransferase
VVSEGPRAGHAGEARPESRRVLYFLRYYPTLTETFVYREIRALALRGWEPCVATFGPRPDGALQDEVPAVRAIRPPGGLAWLRTLAGLLLLAFRPRAWGAFSWLLERNRPKDALKALWLAAAARPFDLLCAHFAGEAAEWAFAASLLWGTPYVVTVHAVDLFRPRPSLREVLDRAACVITISAFNAEILRTRHGVRARVVRVGVAESSPVDPGAQPLVVAAIGRWVPKKGFDSLISAVERSSGPVTLLLVSDAPAERASERVRILGLLPPSEIPAILARCGLVALPARRAADGDMDGVPVVLLEALAAGLPVLTTSLGGIPELVDEAVGWLVPPDDGDALLAALDEAATQPQERRRRGARGPARLEERGFTLAQQAEQVETLWLEVLSGRR